LRTAPVKEKSIRKVLNPAFSAINLIGRFEYGSLEPTRPVNFKVASVRKGTVLIRKDDHMVFEDN
jgi:hypothetical protein